MDEAVPGFEGQLGDLVGLLRELAELSPERLRTVGELLRAELEWARADLSVRNAHKNR